MIFFLFFFFFNDTATTEIYTLSLHDALPISGEALDLSPDRDRLRAQKGGDSFDVGILTSAHSPCLLVSPRGPALDPRTDRPGPRSSTGPGFARSRPARDGW